MRFGDTIIMERAKDGGPKSKVDGFWFFRSKKWGTLALLRFNHGTVQQADTAAEAAEQTGARGLVLVFPIISNDDKPMHVFNLAETEVEVKVKQKKLVAKEMP